MYKKILIAVDLSTSNITAKLCSAAGEMAVKFDAEVRLINVIPDYGNSYVSSFFPVDGQKQLRDEIRKNLKAIGLDCFSKTSTPTTVLRQGKRVKEILAEADEWQPDLIMMGCRTKKSRNNLRIAGSSTTGVTERANVTVMVVR